MHKANTTARIDARPGCHTRPVTDSHNTNRTPVPGGQGVIRNADITSKTLDNSDVREAAAFAHGLQAKALAAGFERVDQRRHQLGPCAPERMAERNAAAVRIDAHRVCLG